MKKISLLLLCCLSSLAFAAPFEGGDAKQGKKTFDEKKCNSCHEAMINGGPDAIFTRKDRKVTNPEQLVAQMKRCSSVGITLTAQEEKNIGAYLNNAFYKFK